MAKSLLKKGEFVSHDLGSKPDQHSNNNAVAIQTQGK